MPFSDPVVFFFGRAMNNCVGVVNLDFPQVF